MRTLSKWCCFFLLTWCLSYCGRPTDAPQNSLASSTASSILPSWINDTLCPMIIIAPDNDNPFEKYGIDFEGVCYSCNVMRVVITSDQLQFINVCDVAEKYILPITKLSGDSTEVIITSNNVVLQWKQIEIAPIVELTILKGKLPVPSQSVQSFFTTYRALPQFHWHDCRDFEG